jgi:ABC-type dipeptide/oligopeptide/nickel transport system permease component
MDMGTAELIPILALASVMGLIATVAPKKSIDTLDQVFLIVVTSFLSFILIILSTMYNKTQYVWLGMGVILALFAYGVIIAERSQSH